MKFVFKETVFCRKNAHKRSIPLANLHIIFFSKEKEEEEEKKEAEGVGGGGPGREEGGGGRIFIKSGWPLIRSE